jgi:hypothetical protein
MRKLCDLLATGECKTQKAAAERVGLHPDHVCRELKKPQVQVFMRRRAAETIASAQLPAAGVLMQLLDAESEHVKRDVAFRVLEEAGVLKSNSSQPITNVHIPIGYVINLAEPVERAGPMIEHDDTEV